MSLTENIFGVRIDEQSLETIANYFSSPKQESDSIEFKSFVSERDNDFRRKETAVLRTINGFLNSNGGVLVWGAPIGETNAETGVKDFVGDLSPVTVDIDKDSFINKIANKITPIPSAIRVEKITHSEGSYIYVIEVESSISKPHQLDGIYYMRLDGQTVKAPHHYVEALFRQVKYPDLGGYIKFERLRVVEGQYKLEFRVMIFNHSALQNEEKVSFSLLSDIGIVGTSIGERSDSRISFDMDNQRMKFDNLAEVLHYGVPYFHSDFFLFHPDRLIASSGEVHIMLHFGGKSSPMKMSEYKIRIGTRMVDDGNELVYERNENVLMVDYAKDKGSEQERLNRILGRN